MSNLSRVESVEFCDDFLRGQYDCSKGVPHKADKSDAYNRGYAAEYELEQVTSELTKNRA